MPTFRKLAVALLVGAACTAAAPVAVAAEADAWSRHDMKLHFGAGFLIGSVVTANTESQRAGALVGTTIGVLKEVVDNSSFHHSTGDALATAVGAFAGSYVTGLIILPGAVWYRFEW